jgi:hypothetical protein
MGLNRERKKIEKALSRCLSAHTSEIARDIETLFRYQLNELDRGYRFLNRLKSKKTKEAKQLKEALKNKLDSFTFGIFLGTAVEWKKRRGLPLDKCLEKMFEIANGYENIKTLGLNYNNIMKGLWNAYNAANNELNNILKAMVESHQKGAYRGDHIINFYESYNRLKDISMALEIEDSDKELPAKLSNALNYGMNFLYAASQTAEQDPILNKNIGPLHLYSDAGLNEYGRVKDIIRDIAREIEKKAKVDFERLENDIKRFDSTIEARAEYMAELVGKSQDFYLQKAEQLASEANSQYKTYLDKFIALTCQYSQLLQEDSEDISHMLNVLNPDKHVNINAKTRKEQREEKEEKASLKLYEFYKTLKEKNSHSLAKLVIDIELSYVNSLKNIDSALNFLTFGF